ncbi:hypothetical protein DFS33DRAFT_1271206 [Desarmillaria ectypa]|nr:hypothetical protein DFS33DRAFT_1271206 [Desarmillaria ectypa]
MSAHQEITHFTFKPTKDIPMTWTAIYMAAIYDTLKADKVYKAAGWRPTHDKICHISRITGVLYPVLYIQWSLRFHKELFEMINVSLLDMPLSDDETVDKESDEEEEEEEEREADNGETISEADGQDDEADTEYEDEESDWENGKEQALSRGASPMNIDEAVEEQHQAAILEEEDLVAVSNNTNLSPSDPLTQPAWTRINREQLQQALREQYQLPHHVPAIGVQSDYNAYHNIPRVSHPPVGNGSWIVWEVSAPIPATSHGITYLL